MEFKYRAVDQRPPQYYPHSPSLSYLPQPPPDAAGFGHPHDMRYAHDMGLSSAMGTDVNHMRERPVMNMQEQPARITELDQLREQSATTVELAQMQERNRSLVALNNNIQYPPNHISNLEGDPVLAHNKPLEHRQYDEIERQRLKQQIREEIIASEIERRRMLEIEVRRELEQEMAMRRAADRITIQERAPMWFDQRFSFVDRVDSPLTPDTWAYGVRPREDILPLTHPLRPFPEAPQPRIDPEAAYGVRAREDVLPLTHPLRPFPEVPQPRIDTEAARSRVIMLAKPTPNVSGAKRKFTNIYGQSSRDPSSYRVKKPKEEYSCALCKVSATSAKGLEDHLKGKKHKMMKEMLRAEKLEKKKASFSKPFKGKDAAGSSKVRKEETDTKTIEPPLEGQKESNDNISTKADVAKKDQGPKVALKVEKNRAGLYKKGKKSNRTFDFWCEPCGVGAFSKMIFETHLKGKKHKLVLGLDVEATSKNVAAAAATENSTKSGPEVN